MNDLAALKRRLRARARELGAADLRVADAAHDETTQARLMASYARGDLATWPYDATYAEAATTPARTFEEAKRVVCVAVPYATPSPPLTKSAPLTGRVSKYAWSAAGDYHRIVRAMLSALAAVLDDFARAPVTRVACDTAPVAERARAARAGLGWIGKHTNLISPSAGSYVFLGEIFTSLELPIDPPLRKNCGSCARCIDACPTGALRGDYTIDATRCISDLTQRTDGIPRELRALVGEWVWGCDICQVVCPPNAQAGAAGDERFAPGAVLATPDLFALLRMRSSEFKRTYARTAMGWRGAAVLRRNAAVALGNRLDRAAVSPLLAALRNDPHPMVRGHAAWALGRIGSPLALAGLRAAAGAEREPSVLSEISSALEEGLGTTAAAG
ncbi:MAG: tRNA epoxyqueuosine(34) reductase QueG [Candidatus Eremiobacteraeota bacterium]|nr:tRNA epoxyqueuosine(34) reductase QueG [Candidatus Eremiobacteraeota bacterium]